MSHLDDEQEHVMQLEKYFNKYAHPANLSASAHSSLTQQNLDSNHNYAGDLRYYAPQQQQQQQHSPQQPQSQQQQQHQLELANAHCILDEQAKDAAHLGMSHPGMEHYHQSLEASKYQEQMQQQQQHQQQQQQQPGQNSEQHVAKTADDDFSVILADVRKTCYSS